jgi:hypothetical protein
MANASSRQLTLSEAIETWILRHSGEHIARICAKYDVDPRRLYEVWEEKKHEGSRKKAEEIINRNLPDGMLPVMLEVHKQKLRVLHLPSKTQLDMNL